MSAGRELSIRAPNLGKDLVPVACAAPGPGDYTGCSDPSTQSSIFIPSLKRFPVLRSDAFRPHPTLKTASARTRAHREDRRNSSEFRLPARRGSLVRIGSICRELGILKYGVSELTARLRRLTLQHGSSLAFETSYDLLGIFRLDSDFFQRCAKMVEK